MKKVPTHKPVVAVIGAGISGLSAAFWLLQNNIDIIVLEQADRPGGVIRSENIDGYLVDRAANCLLNYLPEVNILCDAVGIRDEQIYRSPVAKNRYLLKDDQPVPMPQDPAGFITTNLLSLRGKARLLSEPLIPRVHAEKEETVSEFVARRLGQEVLEQVMEPFIGGTYAGDPGSLCARSTLPMLHSLEQRYGSLIIGAFIRRLKGSRTSCPMHLFSFHRGMETITKAIVQYLGGRFMPRSRVTGIEPKGNSWQVIVEGDNPSFTYQADAVVITTPSVEAAKLISPIDPEGSELLKGIEYPPLAVVYTGFKRDAVKHPLDGIGCMVPSREGYSILGTLWNSTLFDGRAPEGMVAMTNYVGGRRHPGIVEESDERILDRTLTDLQHMLGVKGTPDFVSITRYKKALPQYGIGHQDILKHIEDTPDRIPGLYIAGNYLRGISVRDCISNGAKLATKITRDHGLMA